MDTSTNAAGSIHSENAVSAGGDSEPLRLVPPRLPGQENTLRPTLARPTPSTPTPSTPPAVRSSTIGIRRPEPTAQPLAAAPSRGENEHMNDVVGGIPGEGTIIGRPRSISAPQPARRDVLSGTDATSQPLAQPQMSSVAEEELQLEPTPSRSWLQQGLDRLKRTSTAPATEGAQQSEYDSKMVDLLDVIDPEVSTLSTLTNVQNSLFVPNLGRFVNRRPIYQLTPPLSQIEDKEQPEARARTRGPSDSVSRTVTRSRLSKEQEGLERELRSIARTTTKFSITSELNDSHYAVLPHGVSLEGWSKDDVAMLEDLVRHALHSRRAAFKRGLKGFGKYVRRPLGFFVTLYAFLITAFGLIWFLFLVGKSADLRWISAGERQSYDINVIDNVLVALFAVIGDGLAPFRAVDTYHMIYITHYHRLTWRLRKRRALPKLPDKNDLPDAPTKEDVEYGPNESGEEFVLSSTQQAKLAHHQKKFHKSHTFYRPHETETHHAFPIRLLIAIVVLLDCHSLFQMALGACTWGINYHVRPAALTPAILACSITCNTTAGILISLGDRRTRKKDVIERMFRQELTEEAIKKIEKKKEELAG